MKNKIITAVLVFIVVCAFGGNKTNNAEKQSVYPVPSQTDRLLFYIQRSMNTNTIAYEVNVNDKKQLDDSNPVHPYWIRYEEDGGCKELSYIERKFAYGINSEVVDERKQQFRLSLVSYPFDILLRKTIDGEYAAFITANSKEIELNHIYFQTEGGTFWEPIVKYIDIFGIDLKSGLNVVERVVP